MPFGLGFGETILILAIVLIFFGPRRMPEMGAALGKGIRDFKRALNGISAEINEGANPSAHSVHQPFPVPAQTVVSAPVDPVAPRDAAATATAVAAEHPAEAVVDSISAPVGQIAADHPTFQRTAAPVESHTPADIGAPLRLDVAPATHADADATREAAAPSA